MREKITPYGPVLSDPTLLETRSFIDGIWQGSEVVCPVRDPATGHVVALVSDHAVDAARLAIDAASRAAPDWAHRTAKERAEILLRWHRLILDNADDLASILTAEMGKPVAEARGEIVYGASYIQWFAEEAKRAYGDVIPGHQRDVRIVVLKQPIGVVAAITPWNFPNAMLARKIAPALAAGCTFVGRPSELTPLSALALAVLAERAGVPRGVLNILNATDASGIGLEFCTNSKVRKISFTGSTRVGEILMRQSAHDIKRLSLELGGNAPFIVFEDADVDAAVEGAMTAKFRNNGQTCVCANRIYAHNSLYEEFAEKLTSRVADLRTGNGFEDKTNIGPLINEAAVAKVEAHISDAIAKGAEVRFGGERQGQNNTFFAPTVLTQVSQDMLVCSEETFGPVAAIIPFESEAEVLSQANASEFGLAAYFYSNSLQRCWRVAEALEAGMVGVNTGLISTEIAPFGGVKRSGLGREGSHYGIEDYLEVKNVVFGGMSSYLPT